MLRVLIFLNILLFLGQTTVYSQTYSEEVVEISGVDIARFALKVSFEDQVKQSPTLHKHLLQNLCWSGVFQLINQPTMPCFVKNRNADLQLQVRVLPQDQSELSLLDNEGNRLLVLQISMATNDLFDEISRAVNLMSEQLTGMKGILGTTIAFVLKQPGYVKIIARTDTSGTRIKGMSYNPYITQFPRWSPDGKAILYTTISKNSRRIWLDRFQKPIFSLLEVHHPHSGGTWSPDGKRVIVTLHKNKNFDLFEFDLGSKQLRRLTTHSAIDTSPTLSMNKRSLLFVSDRSGTEQIFLMDLHTKETYQITMVGPRNTDPIWSPDGKLFAYTTTINRRDQIYIRDLEGEYKVAVTQGNFHSEQPQWSPDGKQIIFTSNRSGTYKLYVVSVDGTGLRRLTNTHQLFEETQPQWSQRLFW